MAGAILNYFICGNTARGYYSLLDSNIQGLDRLYILKDVPRFWKSSLMKEVVSCSIGKNFDVEVMPCISNVECLDGVIVPKLHVGFVDSVAVPEKVTAANPGIKIEYLDLSGALDEHALTFRTEKLLQLDGEMNLVFEYSYNKFADALHIHDQWEEIYISSMDFEAADRLAEELDQTILGELSQNKSSIVKHRFMGAATPKGAVDFIPILTKGLKKRYFLKGRPGTGKSTLLKKLVRAAEQKGYDIEVYHCGFDPHSLDMIILREIGIAILDSTSPHEYFPDRDRDEIIDLYARLIKPGTDEANEESLKTITAAYREKIKEATVYLAKAETIHMNMEEIYREVIDSEAIKLYQSRLLRLLEN